MNHQRHLLAELKRTRKDEIDIAVCLLAELLIEVNELRRTLDRALGPTPSSHERPDDSDIPF